MKKTILLFALFFQVLGSSAYSDCLSEKYTDLGFVHIHKLRPTDIDKMNAKQMRDFLEFYLRRYLATFLFFSRDIIAVESNSFYPPTILDNYIKEKRERPDEYVREELKFFLTHPDGVYLENLKLLKEIAPIVEKWDKDHYGKSRSNMKPAPLKPDEMFLVFTQKLGISPQPGSSYFKPVEESLIRDTTKLQWIIFYLSIFGAFLLGKFFSKKS